MRTTDDFDSYGKTSIIFKIRHQFPVERKSLPPVRLELL